MIQQYVIFTDMDGTLLDHNNYDYQDAVPTLTRLKKRGITVIPNTSKTFAEVMAWRTKLQLTGPFIVENGAAIYIPENFFPTPPQHCELVNGYWVYQFSANRSQWIALLKTMHSQFGDLYNSFTEMSLEQISKLTGLSLHDTELAAQRKYGEPVHWLGNDSQKEQFIEQLEEQGATILQGGRFIHVSDHCDKGLALQWLFDEFKRQFPQQSLTSIALGDSHNDIAMLEQADVAIRIRSDHHLLPKVSANNLLITSSYAGPKGWAECITEILNQ
ncbi:HAD-IIB family hydrolase [Alteromonadaceae bacterium BrNp21-10]|nr:HAD-IIB family hydrolase [Alteromonadaceae bacterium BrNp21-10]